MSMSEFFEELGAPLQDYRRSWGAVREADKSLFLRVWEDRTSKFKELGGKYYTYIDAAESDSSFGASERRRHVNLIKEGYKVYMVMCESEDEGVGRAVKDFNDKELFVGGQLVEHNGEILLENAGRVPVRELKPNMP